MLSVSPSPSNSVVSEASENIDNNIPVVSEKPTSSLNNSISISPTPKNIDNSVLNSIVSTNSVTISPFPSILLSDIVQVEQSSNTSTNSTNSTRIQAKTKVKSVYQDYLTDQIQSNNNEYLQKFKENRAKRVVYMYKHQTACQTCYLYHKGKLVSYPISASSVTYPMEGEAMNVTLISILSKNRIPFIPYLLSRWAGFVFSV